MVSDILGAYFDALHFSHFFHCLNANGGRGKHGVLHLYPTFQSVNNPSRKFHQTTVFNLLSLY